MRLNMPSAGNCLFMSIAFAVIQQTEGDDTRVKMQLLSLGVPVMQLRDVRWVLEYIFTNKNGYGMV